MTDLSAASGSIMNLATSYSLRSFEGTVLYSICILALSARVADSTASESHTNKAMLIVFIWMVAQLLVRCYHFGVYILNHLFDARKMQYAPQYRIILFGPTPHSGYGKGDSSSIITELESSEAYPRVERLISGNELKITKSNFREKLQQLTEEDYI